MAASVMSRRASGCPLASAARAAADALIREFPSS